MKIPPVSIAVRSTPITQDNKSTAVTIATWLFTITFLVMFLSREAIKFVVLRKFRIDDLLMLCATILATGLSITTLILASDGLGSAGSLTVTRADEIQKGYYASDFLYIASLCFAKLSLVAFFYRIGARGTQRLLYHGVGGFIILWTVASLVAVALQCGFSNPWEVLTLHCYNTSFFWIVYCIIDMTTDVAIIMLSVNLVAYLQVALPRKITVIACFAPRVLVIGAALARLIYIFPITPHDHPEFNLWVPVICTQLQVCLSISTACIPHMKPFFEGVEAGVWRADDLRRKGLTLNDLYGSNSGYTRAKGKTRNGYSLDSTPATSLKYGRTPDVSPQIPTPVPLSPLIVTPPRIDTPPPNLLSSRSSSKRKPSDQGLRLHIPPSETRAAADVTSPQTASSHALSPECWSPKPLLSLFLPPSPTRPLPPPKGPRSLISSSNYGSPKTHPPSPPQTPHALSPPINIPVFPQPPSLKPPQTPLPPIQRLEVPRFNSKKRVSMHRMAPKTTTTTTYQYIPPVRTMKPQRERPQSRSPNPQMYSSQPWNSRPATPQLPPAPPSPWATTHDAQQPTRTSQQLQNPYSYTPQSPPNPQYVRNKRIINPQNSSRRDQMSPISPAEPMTRMGFWRDGGSGNSAGLNENRKPTVMRDVRSSPRIVVQQLE